MAAPIFLFGQSIAQASFPALSRIRDNSKEFISIFKTSFNQILYLTLPISALFIVLRIPLVRLFYGSGRFDWEATLTTGYTLALLSLSISAQAASLLVARAFYALHDTRTPVKISLVGTLITIISGFVMVVILNFSTWSMALAYAFGQIFSAVTLFIIIRINCRF